MKLSQSQKQILAMTQSLQQSLSVLQMSASELQEHISRLAVENPLTDPDWRPAGPAAYDRPPAPSGAAVPSSEDDDPVSNLADPAQQETFVSHLEAQLPQVARYLPERFLPICRFIIESLDRRGYLDEPIDLLAASMGVSVEDATQALYAVQSLSPAGVGSRTLEECLLLQLTEGPHFNQYTLAIVRHHLGALARRDFEGIAQALDIPVSRVREYFTLIRSLNPIPSNGFRSVQDNNRYIVPEAYVEPEGEELTLRENSSAFELPSVNEEYFSALFSSGDEATREYLRAQSHQLTKLRADISKRNTTLARIIRLMLEVQQDYLLNRSPAPAPLSVQEIADRLELHPSTVSRAVQDKYISMSGHVFPLKSLLCARIGEGIPVTAPMLKLYMDRLIAAEDGSHPLSDESISSALAGMGVAISRRTVADYRKEFGIPPASGRKNQDHQ